MKVEGYGKQSTFELFLSLTLNGGLSLTLGGDLKVSCNLSMGMRLRENKCAFCRGC